MKNKMRLLTPGPTPLPEEVRLTLAEDMVHHRKAEFTACMGRVQAGLRELFGTEEPVLPLSCSGTGAMTAAVYNLFAPGERVIVVEGGKFGQRWSEIARSRGLQVRSIIVDWGEPVRPEDILQELQADPTVTGVLVQASETSTGVLHPIREIAALTRQQNVMLVVDGISAVGISPCPMDAWGVDCLLTGSQKGLMLPPGLALISLSRRAWDRVDAVDPKDFYFNLRTERARSEVDQTLFTSPVNLIRGLEVCLKLFRDQGMEAVFRRQWALTCMVRAGVRALGLELLVDERFTWGLTAIRLPDGVDGISLLRYCEREYGVLFAGGQDHLKGRVVRFGHMGYVDWGDVLAGLYALRQSLMVEGGYSASRDYLEQAMAGYEAGLQQHISMS